MRRERRLGFATPALTALAALAALGGGSGSVAAQEGASDLLPDLRPRPNEEVTFNVVGIPGGPSVNGCMADEIVEHGARRCLRFDQSIANLGVGPFELRYAPPEYASDPYMYQRILRSDDTWRERKAEQYELHPTHAHFHYKGFGVSHLWRSDESGARLDPRPSRSGRKNGFCVMDTEKVREDAEEGRYDGSGCTVSDDYKNGITPGWADTYWEGLPDQYIEVSGVPDGYYQLETIADPDGTVVETDEANNSAIILIRITGNEAERIRVLHDPTVDEPKPEATPPPPPSSQSPAPAPPPPGAAGGGGSPASTRAPARPAGKKKKRTTRSTCKKPRKRASARRSSAARNKRPAKRSCRRKRR